MFCIETVDYVESGKPKQDMQIIQFMEENNHAIAYDTALNTIFVDKNIWH